MRARAIHAVRTIISCLRLSPAHLLGCFSAERVAWNHLGLEIRPAIVQAAADRIRRGGGATQEFTNLRFMTCNFAHSGAALLDAIPGGLLRLVSIQFPDPWRRMKHRKRMLVQPAVVDLLSAKMETGAYVYISTDSRLAMRWMLQCFTAPGSQFQLLPADHDFSADATGGAFMYSAGAARVVEGRGNFGPAALANASEGGEDEEDDSKDEAEGAELDLMETAYAGYFIAYNPLVGIML